MQVKLIPEGFIVEAYPVISSMNSLLIKYIDPEIIEYRGRRWDTRSWETYEIIEMEPYEQKFVEGKALKCLEK